MKKLLIGVLALHSLTAFANEYKTSTSTIACKVSGDIQSITQDKVKLPEVISFDLKITERLEGSKVVKRTISLSDNSPFSIVSANNIDQKMMSYAERMDWDAPRGYRTIKVRSAQIGAKFSFQKLSKEGLNQLLKNLGNEETIPPNEKLPVQNF